MDGSLQVALVIVVGAAAAAWIGAVAMTALVLDVVRGRGEAAGTVDTAARLERRAGIVALVGAVLVAVAGIWYLWDRGLWTNDGWWIGTAIGAWIVAFFGATLLRRPQLRAARRLAVEHGVDAEDVQWRIRQVDLTARGELVLLLTALVVVIAQPG